MDFSQNVKCKTQNQPTYHQKLSKNIDNFVDNVFYCCKRFPPEELYITTSQLKRAALSVALNYHEGHGRFTDKSRTQFLRIAFGSLRESQYLVEFSLRHHFVSSDQYDSLKRQSSELYAMFWGMLRNF